MARMRNASVPALLKIVGIVREVSCHKCPQWHGKNAINKNFPSGIHHSGNHSQAHDGATEAESSAVAELLGFQRLPHLIPQIAHVAHNPRTEDEDRNLYRFNAWRCGYHTPKEVGGEQVSEDMHESEVGETTRYHGIPASAVNFVDVHGEVSDVLPYCFHILASLIEPFAVIVKPIYGDVEAYESV